MSEISILSEEFDPALLREDDVFVVRVIDDFGNKVLNEVTVKLPDQYNIDLTQFVPNDVHCDLERFFDLASQIIANAQEKEGVIEKEKISLVEEFNPEEFASYGDEVIAYKVISRRPARMDRQAKGKTQRGFSHSYDLRFAEYPNKVINVSSRPLDHIIEFSCWSKTATLANKRVLWLERLFFDQTWAFKSKGVERFFFEDRLTDQFMNVSGQRIYNRPLRFFVRLREFRSVAHPTIRSFDFDISISDN